MLLRFVAESLKSPEVCLEAVRRPSGPNESVVLVFVSQFLRTEALCREAVLADRRSLRAVPMALRKKMPR